MGGVDVCRNRNAKTLWRPSAVHTSSWTPCDMVNVTSVTSSPNEHHLVTGCTDGTIKIWDAGTCNMPRVIRYHRDEVVLLSFSKHGGYLAAYSKDSTISMWQAGSWKRLWAQGSMESPAALFAFFNGDGHLAVTHEDKHVTYLDVTDGGRIVHRTYLDIGIDEEISSFVGTTEERRLFTADLLGIRGYNALLDQQFKSFRTTVAVLKAARMHAARSYHDLHGNFNEQSHREAGIRCTAPVISEQMSFLAYGTLGALVVVNIHTDRMATVACDHAPKSIIPSPCEQYLCVIYNNGTADRFQYRLRTGITRLGSIQVPDSQTIDSVAYSSCGRMFTVVTVNGKAAVFSKCGRFLGCTVGSPCGVVAASFNPIDCSLFTLSHDHKLRVVRLTSVCTKIDMPGVINSVALSTDSSMVAIGSSASFVAVKCVTTGDNVTVLWGLESPVNSVTFSPDGLSLATCCDDGSAALWNVTTGHCLQKFAGHTSAALSVAFSPDGLFLATGSVDHSVKLWIIETGELYDTLHNGACVNAIAFNPNGGTLAVARDDNRATVWDAECGEVMQHLEGHKVKVTCVVYSTDGCVLVTGGWDSRVMVWDVRKGECTRVICMEHNRVSSLALSPDGSELVTGFQLHGVRTLDTATGEAVLVRLGCEEKAVRAVAYSADGHAIACGYEDGTVCLTLRGEEPICMAVLPEPCGSVIARYVWRGLLDNAKFS